MSSLWNDRFKNENEIWGDEPSSTALVAEKYIAEGATVLDIGSGYGRDLKFFGNKNCMVTGIDESEMGLEIARAAIDSENSNVVLIKDDFLKAKLPDKKFDLIICHRMAHLLLADETLTAFGEKVAMLLNPGGYFVIGVRSKRDLNLEQVTPQGGNVFEYKHRAGHKIRYWGKQEKILMFNDQFDLLESVEATEIESKNNPVPCYLDIFVARKVS